MTGDFEYEEIVLETKQKRVSAGKKTTWCQTCAVTCHRECIFGDDEKKDCSVMRNGKCTVCRQGCDYSAHGNYQYIVWLEETKKPGSYGVLKKQFVDTQSKLSDEEQVINGLTAQITQTEDEATRLIARMKTCTERLSEIAMKPMAMPSEAYIEQMIQNEEHNMTLG